VGDVTRRAFLAKGSAGAAGAIALLNVGPNVLAAAAAEPNEAGLTPEEVAALDGPLFVRIRDAATGEVEVLVGERSIVFQDKALVAKAIRATK